MVLTKLVSQFYHFSTFSSVFYKLSAKRKRERFNNTGPKLMSSTHELGKTGPAPALRPRCAKTPSLIQLNNKDPGPYFSVPLTSQRGSRVSVLSHFVNPDTNSGGPRTPAIPRTDSPAAVISGETEHTYATPDANTSYALS
jgi:hypothetical protein